MFHRDDTLITADDFNQALAQAKLRAIKLLSRCLDDPEADPDSPPPTPAQRSAASALLRTPFAKPPQLPPRAPSEPRPSGSTPTPRAHQVASAPNTGPCANPHFPFPALTLDEAIKILNAPEGDDPRHPHPVPELCAPRPEP